MKVSELKKIIEVAEDLGCGDAELKLDESRDGVTAHADARATFTVFNGVAVLVVHYQ